MAEKIELQKLCIAETTYETTLTKKFQGRKSYVPPDPNNIRCFIPGVIQKLHVRPGQKVRKGEPLCVLEAMKMQNDIVSPFDARVKSVKVEPGRMVMKGELLVELVPSQSE
ncbi:MAG: biotin attachment protein [Bacteroidetes bacterium]|jgi:biotin carboxyl carrier protein|nr:biotin attachment protein [Bacteroidota bacterium]